MKTLVLNLSLALSNLYESVDILVTYDDAKLEPKKAKLNEANNLISQATKLISKIHAELIEREKS